MSQPRATAARSKTTTARLDLDKKKKGENVFVRDTETRGTRRSCNF